MKISVKAYAKINLFLDMESRRDDGYHNILSVMQSVSLCDTVTVEYTHDNEKNIKVYCNRSDIPCDSHNLAYKAAEIYPLENGNVTIDIDKKIPMSAGLAGGSADAAATLIALNHINGHKLSKEDLKALGAKLGADVPFCIECGTYIAKRVGEDLSQCRQMPHCPIIIAKKGEGMSTPEAYRMLDERFDNFSSYSPRSHMLDILCNPNEDDIASYCKGIFNIFECVVEKKRPQVRELKNIMISHGAVNATMSGSGTSVFGIFKNTDEAEASLAALKSTGAEAHLCYPIQRE